MSLECSSCGRTIEPLPLECGHNISINSETNQWECTMGNCGSVTLENFLCENCCINKSILNIFNNYELLSVENEEFRMELDLLEGKVVQMNVHDTGFKFWVKFGEGKFNYGKGEIEGADLFVTSGHKVMNGILNKELDAKTEYLSGNIKLEGDLQFIVLYFDLLNLALEIKREVKGDK